MPLHYYLFQALDWMKAYLEGERDALPPSQVLRPKPRGLAAYQASDVGTALLPAIQQDPPEGDRIKFDGEDITEMPVQGRPMAMVFQAFALYPHINVYDNLAYPLREMGLSRVEIDKRVHETADMPGLNHVLQRRFKRGNRSVDIAQLVQPEQAQSKCPKIIRFIAF